jgi:hypothetical protein
VLAVRISSYFLTVKGGEEGGVIDVFSGAIKFVNRGMNEKMMFEDNIMNSKIYEIINCKLILLVRSEK